MKTILIVSWIILLSLVSQAQERLTDEDYKGLLDAKDTNTLLDSPALNFWWSERRKTREYLTPQIPVFGNTIGIEKLTYESLFDRYVPGGHATEQALYGESKQEFATLLVFGEKIDRQEFIRAMQLVESQDVLIRQVFNPERAESIIPLRSWAIVRAMYGLDIAAKTSLLRTTQSLQCTVTVQTVDRTTMDETSGCEVVYVPAFWRGVPREEKVFPLPSSPTSHTIRAGRYFMRCRRTNASGQVIDGPESPVDVNQQTVQKRIWIP